MMNVNIKRRFSIDYLPIKAGSILLRKQYGFFKRMWSKLTGKNLPYNEITLFVNECDYIGNPKEDSVLLELKKNYSKKEINKLSTITDNKYFEDYSSNVGELCSVLNIIRPNTFKEDCNSTRELIEINKYYTVKNLKNAESWKELLY